MVVKSWLNYSHISWLLSKIEDIFQSSSAADKQTQKTMYQEYGTNGAGPSSPRVSAAELRQLDVEIAKAHWRSAKLDNKRRNMKDPSNAEEYVYPNQERDADKVWMMFKQNSTVRVVSVKKPTKIGADGFMLRLVHKMVTDASDVGISTENVRIITAMANVQWEVQLKDKAPVYLRSNIYHHGQLHNAALPRDNALIIIDEIDHGNTEGQKLHRTLGDLWNTEYMETHNIRLILISATIEEEVFHLANWRNVHRTIKMEIPPTYIGHEDFMRMGVIKEWYAIRTVDDAEKWVREFLDFYVLQFRIHLIRLPGKLDNIIRTACANFGVVCKFYNTDLVEGDDTETHLTHKGWTRLLEKAPRDNHVVVVVRGHLRRATLIPKKGRLFIGAVMEQYTTNPKWNVLVQGLLGRVTGHHKEAITRGHKIGPYRCHVALIQKYIENFNNDDYRPTVISQAEGRRNICQPDVVGIKTEKAAPSAPKLHPACCHVTIIDLDTDVGIPAALHPPRDEEEFKPYKETPRYRILMATLRSHVSPMYEEENRDNQTMWVIRTDNTWWGVKALLTKDSPMTSKSCIPDRFHKKNFLMVWYYTLDGHNKLIVCPWNGKTFSDYNSDSD